MKGKFTFELLCMYGMLALGVVLLGVAASRQFDKIEKDKIKQSHCEIEDYYGMYYHYRETLSKLLFSESASEIVIYSSKLSSLEKEMLAFEYKITNLNITNGEKINLLQVISAKRMYVQHAKVSIKQAQHNISLKLYSKETKLGIILLTFLLLFSINQTKRSKAIVRRKLMQLASIFARYQKEDARILSKSSTQTIISK